MTKKIFQLVSDWPPAGDQTKAIKQLLSGLQSGQAYQTLLGVTGSGKTFTCANLIANWHQPVLVIAHNKTLAAQLAQEYRRFFPNHAVHYFVSYYDYYQPEAYLAATDTYIEKDAQINQEIERLRHASTQALLTRQDVIIVASVSCIYGLGSPEEYRRVNYLVRLGDQITRQEFILRLVELYYERTTADLKPGQFRATGNLVEVMPPGETQIYQFILGDRALERIAEIDPVSRAWRQDQQQVFLFPAKHFVSDSVSRQRAIKAIRQELTDRLAELSQAGKMLEAERLKRRTNYDLAMLREFGYCSGIENYSRHLSGRQAGQAPDTLLAYFPHDKLGRADFLTIIDESHVTVPQLAGMYAGDASRKRQLVDFGFRLPSALDNRPLMIDEFWSRVGPVIFTSATPGPVEKKLSQQIVEQIIRPTGLLDPQIEVRPVSGGPNYVGQVKDFIAEAETVIAGQSRVMVTVLTKKMAEDLSDYLRQAGIKAEYLHSEIKTLERIKILTKFRQGSAAGGFDCLVGVNLLREGLDLPELSLVGILDADREGFLRSEVSLIQTIGRAARHASGRVILYADRLTTALEQAIGETKRRREIQEAYNRRHGIKPRSISKKIADITEDLVSERQRTLQLLLATDRVEAKNLKKLLKDKQAEMSRAVAELDFETAALLRDEIKLLESLPKKDK